MRPISALFLTPLLHRRIDDFVDKRHEIAERYDEAFRGLPLSIPLRHTDSRSAFHLYVVRLKLDQIGKTHRQVFEDLRSAGIGVNLHYIPVYHHPYYTQFGFEPSSFPESERYYAEAISLPMYAGLTEADQNRVINAVKSELSSHSLRSSGARVG